jgi:hypothetical protein
LGKWKDDNVGSGGLDPRIRVKYLYRNIPTLLNLQSRSILPAALDSGRAGHRPRNRREGVNADLLVGYLARFDLTQTGPTITTIENGASLGQYIAGTLSPGMIFTILRRVVAASL